MASIKKLRDINGNAVYPQTIISAIYDTNNQSLENVLANSVADKVLQCENMPEASKNEGKIVQYIGNSNTDYFKGCFYQAINGSWIGLLDSVPTAGSKNTVTSEGIKNYIDGLVGDIETLLASI